jgi:hypothetical protein
MWAQLDLVSGLALILVVPMISQLNPQDLKDDEFKDFYDYIIVGCFMLIFLRFYAFFLMIGSLSCMILTFINMVMDTVAFILLTIVYLIIMAGVFCLMYQGVPDQSNYRTFTSSLVVLFDGFLASYDYKNMGKYELTHMLLLWIHIFAGNIILFNYLIAILSTTYSNMLEYGTFAYKVKLYQYCLRYITAF